MEYKRNSWWAKRTSLERNLTLVVTLCITVSVSLLVSLTVVAIKSNCSEDTETTMNTIITPTTSAIITTTTSAIIPTTTSAIVDTSTPVSTVTDSDVDNDEICFTQACIETSANILRQMDQTVDPCDDFYQFACGTFLRETVIPDNKASITPFNIIEDELSIQLRKLVEEPVQANEIVPFQNVKTLYNVCMNTSQAEFRGIQPLLDVLQQLGGWPVIGQDWSFFEWTWENFFAGSKRKGFGVSSLFAFEVDTDFMDTTRRTITIDQPQLGIDRQFLIAGLDDPLVKAYHKYQVEMAVLLGSERNYAEKEMQLALEFEIGLAEISKPSEERKDPMGDYKKMTIAELQRKYVYTLWLKYFNDILPEESQLTSEDTIVSFNVDFFESLESLLYVTPKTVIANYVMWRVAMSSVDFLSNPLRNLQHEFHKVLTGKDARDARWQECVAIVLEHYPHALGALYVRKHFKEESKAMVLDMVSHIKHEFAENLKTLDWMDEETRETAMAKLDAMKAEIGFAEEIMDDGKLEEYYANFPGLDENQYFETVHNLKAASADRTFARLNEPIVEKKWFDQLPPAIVMAYYSALENSILLPAGFLQGVFFSADRPKYTNYGAIGIAVGHEITHGFDDQGSQFDAEGNLRDWWAPETRQQFLNRTQCITNQYSRFIEPQTELPINGLNTLGENIADNGGTKFAYRGYTKWVLDNGPEPNLPGLNFSPKQLFWISLGQMWCSLSREAEMRNTVTTDYHSPPRFRVLGPLQNSKEFSQDFACPLESNMNPTEKCEVW